MRVGHAWPLVAVVLVQLVAWGGASAWYTRHPQEVLVVVDTSFQAKPAFGSMRVWVRERLESGRFERVTLGTDKALLGTADGPGAIDKLFRTAFGPVDPSAFARYDSVDSDARYLLTPSDLDLDGWNVVRVRPDGRR